MFLYMSVCMLVYMSVYMYGYMYDYVGKLVRLNLCKCVRTCVKEVVGVFVCLKQ